MVAGINLCWLWVRAGLQSLTDTRTSQGKSILLSWMEPHGIELILNKVTKEMDEINQ